VANLDDPYRACLCAFRKGRRSQKSECMPAIKVILLAGSGGLCAEGAGSQGFLENGRRFSRSLTASITIA
jgi:hypothetical protein